MKLSKLLAALDTDSKNKVVKIIKGADRAKKGGQLGINRYFYKGGQFLPSTDMPPGTWKVGKKKITTKKEEVSPYKWEVQPTPLARSIYSLISAWIILKNNKMEFIENLHDSQGKPLTLDTKLKPGVAGFIGKEEFTLKDLIGLFNKGMRWIEVNIPENIEVVKA